MWNKRHRGVFRRIFILYAVILSLSLLITEVYVTGVVRQNYIDTLTDNLSVQASLVSRDIPFQSPSPIDGLCGKLKEIIHARVTVIAMNGRVLGDSDHDSTTMDNHGGRAEILQAKLSGAGMIVRHSDTLDYDLLYVAKKIQQDGAPQGFIRLSVPLTAVDASVNLLRIKILVVVSAILLATGLFSLWQIDRLRRLTRQIRDFTTALARGDLGRKLFTGQGGEFEEIAESLNAMSAELKKSIAETEEERNRLAVILSSIPDALLISDASGVIRIASAASWNFFGGITLQGKQFIEVVRNREFLSLLDEVRQNHESGVAEFTIDHPEERHCVARVSSLSYEGDEISGFVALFHDITRLKKLEQVRKDFVANISHELKTPITAITGFAETLLEGGLDDRQHAMKFLQTIKTNSERINGLVDDLMIISKLELGSITIEKAPVKVEEVMEQVTAMLGGKAAEKGLSLTSSVAPRLNDIIADKDRLHQILTNLVDNAIKFTEKGSVTLGVSEEGGKTCLFVEDTGIGVPQKYLPRLGERFYRVDPGRSRSMGGTGLGLAIVKHLVKAHGWDMRIESAPGKGTKVKIFLS